MAVASATVCWWVVGLVGFHSRLAVDIGIGLFLAALVGLTTETGPAWTVAMPTAPDERSRRPARQDARLMFLRRTLQDASSNQSRADPRRTSPTSLQRSLRAVAAHRAGQRIGRPLDPEDRTTLASQLDPQLAEYLCATPPSPVDARRLDDLIRRIENL